MVIVFIALLLVKSLRASERPGDSAKRVATKGGAVAEVAEFCFREGTEPLFVVGEDFS